VDAPISFAQWRRQARICLAQERPPEQLDWGGLDPAQGALFSQSSSGVSPEVAPPGPRPRVAGAFLREAQDAALFRADDRWALLYRVLWRLTHGEPQLMEVDIDEDVARLRQRARAVRRDQHKMKAFVRFKRVVGKRGDWYLAWFEPTHLILQSMADFFCGRFATMCWGILTPDGGLFWDTVRLYRDDSLQSRPELNDEMESMWTAYYRNVFNPARLKLDAMRKEMPRRYWKNLPEAVLIHELSAAAPARERQMLQARTTEADRLRHKSTALARQQDRLRAAASAPPPTPDMTVTEVLARCSRVDDLLPLLEDCRRCEAWCRATQVVPGRGPAGADIMIVGEQPGDREDLLGQAFVGPAGALLQQALSAAGIDRERLYLTNAVKHFNWTGGGKRRIHQRPSARQVKACALWLDAELALLRPRAVLVLGNTAGRRLLGAGFALQAARGQWIERGATRLFATVHPAAVLRSADEGRAGARAEFFADIDRFARELTLPLNSATALQVPNGEPQNRS
jgi:probable DNA metabolism protein